MQAAELPTIVPAGTPGATPILVQAFELAGVRKGAAAVSCLVAWAIAEESVGLPLGDDLTSQVRNYAKWWRITERTAWRDLAAFKQAFPGEDSPARLAAELRQAVELRRLERREAMALAGSLALV